MSALPIPTEFLQYGAFGVIVMVLVWFMQRFEKITNENTVAILSVKSSMIELITTIKIFCEDQREILRLSSRKEG